MDESGGTVRKNILVTTTTTTTFNTDLSTSDFLTCCMIRGGGAKDLLSEILSYV